MAAIEDKIVVGDIWDSKNHDWSAKVVIVADRFVGFNRIGEYTDSDILARSQFVFFYKKRVSYRTKPSFSVDVWKVGDSEKPDWIEEVVIDGVVYIRDSEYGLVERCFYCVRTPSGNIGTWSKAHFDDYHEGIK